MTQQQRVRILVHGRVQGVFFRASLRDIAEDLTLAGWVRNTPEGLVEAELQGDENAIDKALAFCRQGPQYAEVTHLDVTDIPPIERAAGFRVR